ncbi:HD domain-containing phosphohydrolase [Desulfobacula phenolica]|uniref:Response regulator c-di-GMP phosphodiesterase, RpfG family, contains REC and HD-GYP domains n=1 Tax=Desulfobacula phenolica TaxID=90732 RepID=A0A1H2DNJ6_9BACT|nr:HD domain-containing phosphohydrolase [Desulfobacula phenolica]SDT84465.1 Response regulator c-di-GMP phosphodiesterase, RpfG family, contains REC and HD-GYP domains [Desulfobacula phenolica]
MEKEFVSLLYIYDSKIRDDLSKFSKQNGFILNTCDDFFNASDQVELTAPDLILIESGANTFKGLEKGVNELIKTASNFKPAVFLVLSEFPEPENRLAFLGMGIDEFLIKPFFIRELKEKYNIYHQLKHFRQKILARDRKIEKTFEYLDKFKNEIKKTKTELFEERTTLNNALKQINHMTVERNRLKKEKRELKNNLADNMEGFGEILSRLIKAGIEKNRGHGERVAHIVHFIGKQLKLDEKKLEDLKKAAMLHEVGLLFIPQVILNKAKDQLTDYEKDLFVQYPVKGADLLSICTEFGNCAHIIRYLNENADGTGSPQRLKRRYIPLLSRILSGADVFDTLKNEKDVTSLERFLEKLEGFSGTRLDPNIVVWLETYAVLHMGSDSYRVKGVGVHQLEPGMSLGTALFTNTGTKLFSVNTLLTKDAIDKIKKYNREYPVNETVYIRA